jgi:hypothetical protein
LCALQIIRARKISDFPPGIPENTMGWYEESAPQIIMVPSNCELPETGDSFIVTPCSATIWTWWEPPEHEMEHYGCLTSLKKALGSLATDLGCVCEQDACYMARKNLIYARANYAIAQHAVCHFTLDCQDNGKGKITDPYCKQLVASQVKLFLKKKELQTAKEQVAHVCQ